jgi:hypothetical protein
MHHQQLPQGQDVTGSSDPQPAHVYGTDEDEDVLGAITKLRAFLSHPYQVGTKPYLFFLR